jgi:hypothetical protein
MIVPILCMVSLCLLAWVIVLKMEIDRLKGGNAPEQKEGPRRSAVKGMQSYSIG